MTKVNLGTKENLQHVKVNASLESIIIEQLIEFFKEFVWTYKDMKGIPPETTQHKIEFDTTCSSSDVPVES